MAFNLSDFFFGAGRGHSSRALQEEYAFVDPFQYQGQQDALIQQLQQQMSGQNSLAESQYRGLMQDSISSQAAMSRGRGAGAARNAQANMGQLNSAIAAGASEAQLKERMAAAQQLQGALTSANQIDFQRQMANQAMYQQALQNMMSQGGIGQSLLGLAGQGLGAYAMLRGPGQKPQPQQAGPNPLQPLGQGLQAAGQALGQALSPFGGSPGPTDPWA